MGPLLQGCPAGYPRGSQAYYRVLHGCSKGIRRVLHGCSRSSERVLTGYSTGTQRLHGLRAASVGGVTLSPIDPSVKQQLGTTKVTLQLGIAVEKFDGDGALRGLARLRCVVWWACICVLPGSAQQTARGPREIVWGQPRPSRLPEFDGRQVSRSGWRVFGDEMGCQQLAFGPCATAILACGVRCVCQLGARGMLSGGIPLCCSASHGFQQRKHVGLPSGSFVRSVLVDVYILPTQSSAQNSEPERSPGYSACTRAQRATHSVQRTTFARRDHHWQVP
jgi:hypothetical protein